VRLGSLQSDFSVSVSIRFDLALSLGFTVRGHGIYDSTGIITAFHKNNALLPPLKLAESFSQCVLMIYMIQNNSRSSYW
jgi:hypothetical protein